jgi:tetratricopeptide (TPR) repeat protein
MLRKTPSREKRPPSDRALRIAVRVAVAVLVLGSVAFGAVYYLGQRTDGGPSLIQRQVSTAEQQVRTTPNNLAARLALAQAYQAAQRPDDALAQYDLMLKAVPTYRAAMLGKAAVLLAKNDLSGASAMYKKVTGMSVKGEFAGADPQLQEAHYFLAVIASRQGQPQQAVTEAQAALKIEPTDSDAWYVLGSAQLAAGQPEASVVSLQRALMFVPTGWCEPYVALGKAFQRLGKAPQAEYASAMVDFCQQRPAQAQQRLEKLTSGPAGVDADLGLGAIAENGGRQDDAIGWYRKAVAADPTNTSAIQALSRLGIAPTAAASPAASGKG